MLYCFTYGSLLDKGCLTFLVCASHGSSQRWDVVSPTRAGNDGLVHAGGKSTMPEPKSIWMPFRRLVGYINYLTTLSSNYKHRLKNPVPIVATMGSTSFDIDAVRSAFPALNQKQVFVRVPDLEAHSQPG